MTAIPIPDLPPHLTISWGALKAACFVECSRCRTTEVVYTYLLLRRPEALGEVVAGHSCLQGLNQNPAPPTASPDGESVT